MMFPMIPQYFFSKSVECAGYASMEKISSPAKVKKKCEIVVSGVIEVDVESENIAVDALLEAGQDEVEEVNGYFDKFYALLRCTVDSFLIN